MFNSFSTVRYLFTYKWLKSWGWAVPSSDKAGLARKLLSKQVRSLTVLLVTSGFWNVQLKFSPSFSFWGWSGHLLCYWWQLACELLNLFQPDTLFMSTGKKSFSVRLSELAYQVLPELGTAQPLTFPFQFCNFLAFSNISLHFCQAQPQFQLQLGWVSFILDFPHHISWATTTTYPAQPPPHILRNYHHISCATTTRASSEIGVPSTTRLWFIILVDSQPFH